MFSVSIALGNVVWALLYKQRQTADNAWASLESADSPMTVEDDFGQRLEVRKEKISGLLFEDLDVSRLAHIERGLHQARTQIKAQQMAEADPMLRSSAMLRSTGPAMLSSINGPHR